MSEEIFKVSNLSKSYHCKDKDVDAVKNVSLSVKKGEIFGIIGYSGAGKSSLVRCLNLLEKPDFGDITFNGIEIAKTIETEKGPIIKLIKEKELKNIRKSIGMIFQHFNLFDRSTVFENVLYPIKYSKLSKKEKIERVNKLLDLVDLREKANTYPSQLSGGQKQRVAIARALANNPSVLLSDEATSALDPDATESVLSLLKKINRELGLTIILITHEMAVVKEICHRVLVMENCKMVEEGDVYSVFANPKKAITKKFVLSSSPLNKIEKLKSINSPLLKCGDNAKLVKMTFGKECVGDAFISKVSVDYNVKVNIILANVDVLKGDVLGSIVAIIDGETKDIEKALAFFKENKVKVEFI